jgi:dUTP pyrophosphatase
MMTINTISMTGEGGAPSEAQTLWIRRLDPRAQAPIRAHSGDAGLDLSTLERVVLPPHGSALVGTGLSFAIPMGSVGLVLDRSSMAKKGVKTVGGVIDAGYRGELKVLLWNLSAHETVLEAGDRIAQLVLFPVLLPQPQWVGDAGVLDDEVWVNTTSRGAGGFGSSGR